MLHHCCNGGYCSCEVLHGTVPFSILFPVRNNKASMQRGGREEGEEEEFYSPSSNINSSSSSSCCSNNNNSNVDCTLSLGTPSTRQTHNYSTYNIKPSFCSWDFFSHSNTTITTNTTNNHGNSTMTTTTATTCLAGDPLLLARRCANCDTTSTPLWRNGPRGPKSLCNACGIRYKKEERRAAAASSKAPSISMSFSGDVDEKNDYLSWRLNVVPRDTNRTSLFQYQ